MRELSHPCIIALLIPYDCWHIALSAKKTISQPRNISLPFFKGTLRASSGPSIEWCGTDWTPSNPLLLRQPLTADNLPNAPHLIGLGFFKKCRITEINAINCKCPALNWGKIFLKTPKSTFLGDSFFLFGKLFLDSDVFFVSSKSIHNGQMFKKGVWGWRDKIPKNSFFVSFI